MQIKGTAKPKFQPSASVIPRQINLQKFFRAKYDRPNSEIKYASGTVDISSFLSKNKDYSTLDNSHNSGIQENNSKKNLQTNRYFQQSHTIDVNLLEKAKKQAPNKTEKISNSPFFMNQARKTKPVFGVKYMKMSPDINQISITQRQNFRQINLQQVKSTISYSDQETSQEINIPQSIQKNRENKNNRVGQNGQRSFMNTIKDDGQHQTLSNLSQFSRTQKQKVSQSVSMQSSQKNEFTRLSQSVQKEPKKMFDNLTGEIFKPQYKIICSYRTRQGFLASNPEKVNQDAFQICQNFCKKGQHLFFVCDGHGANGHFVSNFIKAQYPKSLQKVIENGSSLDEAIDLSTNYINRVIQTAGIDVQLSGSTFIQLLIDTQTGKLTCGNVGDSRAIIASTKSKEEWHASPLSQDHKPNLPSESQRIQQCGGRVDSYKDSYGRPLGPKRVWLKNENMPGLAMSRSIGDLVAQSVGVTPQPEIIHYQITAKDKIIVIASDGVWEFLSNEQVMFIITPYFEKGDINGACENLMKEALSQWTADDGSVIDDITFIIIFIEEIKNLD